MMTRRQANVGILASAALAAAPAFAATQELNPIELPPPRTEGSMPPDECAKAETFDTRVFGSAASSADPVGSIVGCLR